MPEFTIVDDDTGMEITLEGDQAPAVDDLPEIFGQARKQSAERLASGKFKLGADLQHLDKAGQRESIRKHSARALGISPDDVDIDSGMGFWDRTKLSMQPTDADKMKQLEDTYGKDGVAMLDVGGTAKMFFRDPKTKKMTMVDEQGASFADFTADIAGFAPEVAGAVVGGIKGAAAGTAVAPGVGTIVGGVLGAAGGGFAAGTAQDVATRAVSGEDIQLGEITGRRGKEAVLGAGIDVALLGTGKFVAKPLMSKLTGDATAKAFGKAAEVVGDDAITPRMLQGEEALTRELGLESRIGGRVGDARKALDTKAKEIISQSNPEAYERFASKVQSERNALIDSIPASERKLLEGVNERYNEALQGFGDSRGRVLATIGDDIIENNATPAFKAARQTKNDLYDEFDRVDAEVGGVFTPKDVVRNFDRVLAKNRLKNASAIKTIQKEISAAKEPFTIGEIDDLISRVTDAMPDDVVKDKTASQLASQLSDSLTKSVQRKAAKFPELNQAWKNANDYYKRTYLQFNRGALGGSVKDVSGAPILTGQRFINQVLSDPAEIDLVLSAAKEGGQSPSVVKNKLKEAFLEKRGIRKGSKLNQLNTESDRGVIEKLWGKRGLKRWDQISKGLQASPEKLDDYLGALSDARAREVRSELDKLSKDKGRLDQIQKNVFMRELADGNIPAGSPDAITQAYLKLPKSKRDELFKNMSKNPEALEDLKGSVGANVMLRDIDESPFKDAIGENLFNGKSALRRLDNNREKLIDLLGNKEYEDLRTLARAQSKLAPLTKDQARTKLRTLAGAGGLSFYIVGDIISAMKDKFVALAYKSKSLDGLMNGWSKLDEKAMGSALNKMLYTAQGRRALESMDDPELEAQVELLKQAVPSQ